LVLRSVHHHLARRRGLRLLQRADRHGVQLVLRFRSPPWLRVLTGSPGHVSALSGRAPARILPVMRDQRRRSRLYAAPVSRRLSAHRRWLLDHPVPARGIGLPHSRPTGQVALTGPRPGFHVPHQQDTTGVGAPYTPGTVVSTRSAVQLSDRHPPLRNGQSLHPAGVFRLAGLKRDEASSRVHLRSPVRSSPCLWPRAERRPLGLFPELRTPPLPATHVRAGTGLGH
jgi:hypothetical protein